jgi:hypothetical protein
VAEIVRTENWQVDARLRELDLTVGLLRQVGEAALRARASCSPLHPPTYPGTAAWGASVLTLRTLAIPRGFRAADPGNFSMTINDDKRFYIVAATGDEHAGYYSGRDPSTKTPKGLKTQQAVRRQLTLWPEAETEEAKRQGGVEGYFGMWLLLNFRNREVQIELSVPSEIRRGKIVDWHERNIIPAVRFDPEAASINPPEGDGFAPDFDVPVQRIA